MLTGLRTRVDGVGAGGEASSCVYRQGNLGEHHIRREKQRTTDRILTVRFCLGGIVAWRQVGVTTPSVRGFLQRSE